jgi:hypothetical protein
MPRILLKDAFPNLFAEIDIEKTIELGVNPLLLTPHCNVKVVWKCLTNEHPSYVAMVSDRNGKRVTYCPPCSAIKSRIKQKLTIKSKGVINSTKIGDDLEEYIIEKMIESLYFKDVERIGQFGGNCDISAKIQNNTTTYFIQVKSLVLKFGKIESYNLNCDYNYARNLLIVAANKERTRFAIGFFKDLGGVKGCCFTFGNQKSRVAGLMHYNINDVMQKLSLLLPQSVTENVLTEAQQKEFESFNRLKIFMNLNGLKITRNTTHASVIDCFIEGTRVQCKYGSLKKNSKVTAPFSIGIVKSAGGGKEQPYSSSDPIDMMIVELGTFHGNFCIIPNLQMIKMGYFQTNSQPGKVSMTICPPDYTKEHWSKPYWNNLNAITSLLQNKNAEETEKRKAEDSEEEKCDHLPKKTLKESEEEIPVTSTKSCVLPAAEPNINSLSCNVEAVSTLNGNAAINSASASTLTFLSSPKISTETKGPESVVVC